MEYFIPAAISLSTACWVRKTQPWVFWDHRQVVLSAWCLFFFFFFLGCYLKIQVSRALLECVLLPPLCCGREGWEQAFKVKVHTLLSGWHILWTSLQVLLVLNSFHVFLNDRRNLIPFQRCSILHVKKNICIKITLYRLVSLICNTVQQRSSES